MLILALQNMGKKASRVFAFPVSFTMTSYLDRITSTNIAERKSLQQALQKLSTF